MVEHSQIAQRLMIGIGTLTLLCIGGAVLVLMLRPPLRTYQDIVAYALGRHHVAYREIHIGATWPDNINRQYGSNVGPISITVEVQLANGSQAPAWLQCREIDEGCTFSMRSVGINAFPVPNITDSTLPDWVNWLEPYLPVWLVVRTSG